MVVLTKFDGVLERNVYHNPTRPYGELGQYLRAEGVESGLVTSEVKYEKIHLDEWRQIFKKYMLPAFDECYREKFGIPEDSNLYAYDTELGVVIMDYTRARFVIKSSPVNMTRLKRDLNESILRTTCEYSQTVIQENIETVFDRCFREEYHKCLHLTVGHCEDKGDGTTEQCPQCDEHIMLVDKNTFGKKWEGGNDVEQRLFDTMEMRIESGEDLFYTFDDVKVINPSHNVQMKESAFGIWYTYQGPGDVNHSGSIDKVLMGRTGVAHRNVHVIKKFYDLVIGKLIEHIALGGMYSAIKFGRCKGGGQNKV